MVEGKKKEFSEKTGSKIRLSLIQILMSSQDHLEDDFEGEFRSIRYLPKRKIDNEELGELATNSLNLYVTNKRSKKVSVVAGSSGVDTSPDDPLNKTGYSKIATDLAKPLPETSEDDIEIVKTQLLDQLNGNFEIFSSTPSVSEKYTEIYSIFERTIRDKESHSVLMVGPRSSGKTTIVKSALKELDRNYNGEFISIYLNSSVQTDDSSALREIARQLDINVKKDVGDDGSEPMGLTNEKIGYASFEKKSINDTFSNILSVLTSHKGERDERMPLVFVIDEFEKFTVDNRQTLLYNLLDISQSSATPICVVGLTTKITTKETLEKRVSSRFSQRVISLVHETSLDNFWDNCKASLLLQDSTINTLKNPEYGLLWNEHIEQLYCKKNSLLRNMVVRNYHSVKDYRKFNNACRVPVSKLSAHHAYIEEDHFKLRSAGSNGVQDLVTSLSDLELLLVIAGVRWIEKFEIQTINFNLAYTEYQEMVKDFNTGNAIVSSASLDNRIAASIKVDRRVLSRKVSLNSWGTLYKLGILLDPKGDTVEAQSNTYSYHINKNLIIEENQMVLVDITLDELNNFIEDKHAFKRFVRL